MAFPLSKTTLLTIPPVGGFGFVMDTRTSAPETVALLMCGAGGVASASPDALAPDAPASCTPAANTTPARPLNTRVVMDIWLLVTPWFVHGQTDDSGCGRAQIPATRGLITA